MPLLSTFLVLMKQYHSKSGVSRCHLRFSELLIFRTKFHFRWRFQNSGFHCSFHLFLLVHFRFSSVHLLYLGVKHHSLNESVKKPCSVVSKHKLILIHRRQKGRELSPNSWRVQIYLSLVYLLSQTPSFPVRNYSSFH